MKVLSRLGDRAGRRGREGEVTRLGVLTFREVNFLGLLEVNPAGKLTTLEV